MGMSAEDIARQQMAGLGDLTEPIKRERGEFDVRTDIISRPVPHDVQRQSQIYSELLNAPPPPPSATPGNMLANDTLSVYELLPANAGHLSYGALFDQGLSNAEGIIFNGLEIFSKVVPPGRVAYVRAASVNIDTETNGIPAIPYSFSILRNGNVEVFNQDIFVQAFDDFYPVYVIAGPGDIITITVSYDFSAAIAIPSGIRRWLVHLTGDMLLPNELPIPYTGLKSGSVKAV